MGSKPGGWWGWFVGMMDFLFFCRFFFTLSVFEVVGTKWFVFMLKPFGYFDFLVIKWMLGHLAFFQFERGDNFLFL